MAADSSGLAVAADDDEEEDVDSSPPPLARSLATARSGCETASTPLENQEVVADESGQCGENM
jgi:hypothetical protein